MLESFSFLYNFFSGAALYKIMLWSICIQGLANIFIVHLLSGLSWHMISAKIMVSHIRRFLLIFIGICSGIVFIHFFMPALMLFSKQVLIIECMLIGMGSYQYLHDTFLTISKKLLWWYVLVMHSIIVGIIFIL